MKRILIFIVISIVISGCKKERVELVPDLDKIYLSSIDVDSPAEILKREDGKTVKESIISYLEENNFRNKTNAGVSQTYEYMLYINEEGKIDKVKIINGMGDKFDSFLLDDMTSWKFKPAMKNNFPVNSQMNWGFTYYFSDGAGLSEAAMHDSSVVYDESLYFIDLEEMPAPIGGIQELAKNIKYPETAKNTGLQGKVFVKAFINEQGEVVRAEIIKGIGGGCDQAAIDAIIQTKFTPGIQDGKPVKTQVSIPILFKLH